MTLPPSATGTPGIGFWREGYPESKPHMDQEKEGMWGFRPYRFEVSVIYIQCCKYFRQIAPLQQCLTMTCCNRTVCCQVNSQWESSKHLCNIYCIYEYLLRKYNGLYFVGNLCTYTKACVHTHTHTQTCMRAHDTHTQIKNLQLIAMNMYFFIFYFFVFIF